MFITVTVDGQQELVAKTAVVRVIAGRPASTFVDALPTRLVLTNGSVLAVEESVQSLRAVLNAD